MSNITCYITYVKKFSSEIFKRTSPPHQGAHGIANWAKFESSGHTLTNEMAEMANKNAGFAPGKGPFKEGMKAENFGVDDKGSLMINKASITEGGVKETWDKGEITRQYAGNADQIGKLQKEIAADPTLNKDFGIAARDLKPGMEITERRETHGNLIGFNGRRSGRTEKEDIAKTDMGARIHKGNDVRIGDDMLTGDSKIRQDVDMTEIGRGTNVKIGMAPMTMAVTTGNAQFVAGQYDGLLSGKGPTVGGVSLVNETADMVGGYGKLQQSLQDYAGAVASGQVAFNSNKIPMIGRVLDKLGIDFSAKGGAEIAKRALETMDVNTFKMAFQESYINDISKNPSVSEQAKQIAGMGMRCIAR